MWEDRAAGDTSYGRPEKTRLMKPITRTMPKRKSITRMMRKPILCLILILSSPAYSATLPTLSACSSPDSDDLMIVREDTDTSDCKATVSQISSVVLTGNAATATALAADPTDCSAGSFPLGINASGTAQSCTDAWTEAENTSAAYQSQIDGKAATTLGNLASVAINTTLLPASDGGAALGSGTFAFSNLFLDTGSVIDWNNNDCRLTHSTNLLAFTGCGNGYTYDNAVAAVRFNAANGSTSAGAIRILEDSDDGSNYTQLSVTAMAANVLYTLPPDDGDAGEQLQTDGSGGLTWESAGGIPTTITVADTTDSTSFCGLFESATGDLGPKTDAGCTYDASNGTLASTIFNTATLTLTGTGTLNGLDAIDGTGEATLEAALDIGGEVVSTGLSSAVIADSVTVTGWVLGTSSATELTTANTGLHILDTNATHDLIIAPGSNITADRTLTITTGDNNRSFTFNGDYTGPSGTATLAGLDSTQTFTNKTISGALTLAESGAIALDPAGSADGAYSGITIAGTSGYTQAFGDLVYLDPTDSRWEAVDANAASAADGDARGIIGMVVVAATDGNACTILLQGSIRADAAFPTFTVNAPIYASETAGDVTNTAPSTASAIVRVVGQGLTGNDMYFNGFGAWVEIAP